MLNKFMLTLFILLGTFWPTAFVMAQQIDCSKLDPRDHISTEKEGKVQVSVNTLFKIAKVGGSLEGKMKEEIQNLPKGSSVSEQNIIKLRFLYIFCGMVANAKDISSDRKVELFDHMMDSMLNTTVAVPTPVPTLSSISITPADLTLDMGVAQWFTATGTYSDGTSQNITTQVTWQSSNTAVAMVDSNGVVKAVGPGTATITATSGIISRNTTFTVTPKPLLPPARLHVN